MRGLRDHGTIEQVGAAVKMDGDDAGRCYRVLQRSLNGRGCVRLARRIGAKRGDVNIASSRRALPLAQRRRSAMAQAPGLLLAPAACCEPRWDSSGVRECEGAIAQRQKHHHQQQQERHRAPSPRPTHSPNARAPSHRAVHASSSS